MPAHNLAFWLCAFFLLGVFAVSIFNNLLIVLILSILVFSFLLVFKRYLFAILSLAVILGAGYYQVFSVIQKSQTQINFDEKIEFQGVVTSIKKSATSQQIILNLGSPLSGKVRMNAQRYPDFNYGDLIKAEGIIKKPLPEAENYYAKEGISGLVNFPKAELIEAGRGNPILAALLKFKEKIESIFRKALPGEKAAFLSGITLGERESFSKDLEEKMSLSGTTHLVALSGYNISVIAIAISTLFGSWFSRAISFYLSVAVIILFVLMTGAEASVVRAAIMGIIGLFAQHSERQHSVRNAIIIAAFLMVLVNPRVLVFDLGFQLSFAALLGIIYLLPVLEKFTGIKGGGIFNWKDNFLTTIAAQLAVIPLVLGNFGVFSLTSFWANILILGFMPITMGLGFTMAGVGLFSDFLAKIIGLAVNLFLAYELWVINLFSKLTLPVATESFGLLSAIIYYSVLISFIVRSNKIS